jgi:penicillin-binding protein 1A
VLLAAIALAVSYPNLPEIDSLTDYRPKLPMRVFSADGVLLGEFGEERRNFMPIAQIPKVMQDAVLAGRGRALLQAQRRRLRRRAARRPRQLRRRHTRTGRIDDHDAGRAQFLSLDRENIYSQDLRDVAFAEDRKPAQQGADSRGLHEPYRARAARLRIRLGQRDLFRQAAQGHHVAEAAMLAGLPKAPSANNPIVNPERATRRQRYVIDRMLENGFITVAQRDAALKQVLKYRAPSEVAVHAEYVAEQARQMIFNQYGAEAYTRGLNVYLTLNSAEQTLAYHALRKGIMDYEKRQVYRGPEDYVDLPRDRSELDARIAEALQDFPDNDELRAAVVTEASAKKVVAMLQNGESVTVTGDGLKPRPRRSSPRPTRRRRSGPAPSSA